MIGLPETAEADGAEETGAILTPLVDVVFMLVAFLILTANSLPLALDVDLPATDGAAPSASEQTVIRLDVPALAGWQIETVPYADPEAARTALADALAARPDALVRIAIDRDTPVQRLIDAFDMSRGAGAEQVEVAAEHPQQAPATP